MMCYNMSMGRQGPRAEREKKSRRSRLVPLFLIGACSAQQNFLHSRVSSSLTTVSITEDAEAIQEQ